MVERSLEAMLDLVHLPLDPILVIGDIMIDATVHGRSERQSPEAPVPVILNPTESVALGGAANVAANLVRLGAPVMLVGNMGEEYADTFSSLCGQYGIQQQVYNWGPTIIKKRIVANGQQVARIDREQAPSLSTGEVKMLERDLGNRTFSGVVISDYAKGMMTNDVVEWVLQTAHDTVPTFVDMKPTQAKQYVHVDYVLPNISELEQLTHPCNTDAALRHALEHLNQQMKTQTFVTRSADGVSYLEKGNLVTVPTSAEHIRDVQGAGDSALAGFVLAKLQGATDYDAALFANAAGHAAVMQKGTAVINKDDLISALRANLA